MRDAQSILDQMISFCGKTILQSDVLKVYGLASKDILCRLAELIIHADYAEIIKLSDSFSVEGIDFYRALLDLSDNFRELLLDLLRKSKSVVQCEPEQCVRILDALRHGEDLVRMGLSEKTNFEVTLFRAVEAGRTRSIDQVIRKISGMLPDDVKKKAELKPPSNFEVESVKDSSEKKEKKAKLEDSKKNFPEEILSRDIHEEAITAKGKEVEGSTQLSVEEESSAPTLSSFLETVGAEDSSSTDN